MPKRLRVQSQAQDEINQAFNWYFERSPAAADGFLTEIDACILQITDNPLLFPAFTKNTRRCVLPKFPYSVIFKEQDEVILVLAVAHAKRRPGYWQGRV